MHRNTHKTLAVRALTFGLCLCSSATAETVRFIVTSDARRYPGYAEVLAAIQAVGDERERDNKKRADFMITTGDMDPLVEAKQKIDAAFGSGFEWYPVMGNHEKEHEEDVQFLGDYYWNTLHGYVNPGPFGSGGTTYSFDKGPVHFVILDVYWNGEPDDGADPGFWPWEGPKSRVQPELLTWLKNDLANSNKRWNLLFFHNPVDPQPCDQHLEFCECRHKDKIDKDEEDVAKFCKVLEDCCVTACFVSHTHRYSAVILEATSRVWQLDSAMARGPEDDGDDEEDEDDEEDDEEDDDNCPAESAYDTFFIVEADDTKITVDVYRRLYDENITWREQLDLTVDESGVEFPPCPPVREFPICGFGSMIAVPCILATLAGMKVRVGQRRGRAHGR